MAQFFGLTTLILCLSLSSGLASDQPNENLAKQSQNPVGDLISLPFEFHHYDGIQGDASVNALFIKPVYPTRVGDFNLINRAIIPILDLDSGSGGYDYDGVTTTQGISSQSGLGNIQYQGFFSPRNPGKIIWGLGPVIEAPTHSEDLGSDHWSAGISTVVLTMPGNWVLGALVQNIWSIGGGSSDEADINKLTFQYFVNYNLDDGWYLTSTPINTADWEADSDNRWTVPIGGGFGRLVRFGKLPVDFRLQAFGYAEQPDGGPDWNTQFSVKFLFPK